MGVTDNALQQLLKLSVDIKTLWTNASPTSEFAAQTIRLIRGNNDAFLIKAHWSTTSNIELYVLVSNKVEQETEFYGTELATYAASKITIAKRNVTVVDAGISFNNGVSGQTRYDTDRPYWFIPISINGIKFLGGGYSLIRKIKHLFANIGRRCFIWQY